MRRRETLATKLKRQLRNVYATVAGDADADKPSGLTRWLTTVDHRDIGLLYICFGIGAGLLGGVDGMMIRTELLTPSADVWGMRTYNALFTTHGLTMLFFFATPVFFGLGNYLVPLLIGADDMAFPRVNALAFWLLPPAALLVRGGLVAEMVGIPGVRPAATGWTLYTPLSTGMPNAEVDLLLLGLHLSGVSTIAASINFVVTILVERDEAVTWGRLDILSWTYFTTAGLAVFAFPVLGSSLLMLLADRNLGTAFFTVEGGGALLWQHLFWFFGHPEVYILVLPPMGVLSLLIPRLSGRRLFGFKFVVYSTLAIGVLSFGVWAHHMFATSLDPRLQSSFMAVTLAISVPSAVKTFNWITTMWNGRLRLDPPTLFCVGAVFNFVLGGVSGVFLASIPVDRLLHGTYFVVAHFHLLLVGTIIFAAFAAWYYWFPLFTGRNSDPTLARIHFWLTALATPLTFSVMFGLGLDGLPRRTATYPVAFATPQQFTSVCAYVLGFAQLVWLLNAVHSTLFGSRIELDDLRTTGRRGPEWRSFVTAREHSQTDDPPVPDACQWRPSPDDHGAGNHVDGATADHRSTDQSSDTDHS